MKRLLHWVKWFMLSFFALAFLFVFIGAPYLLAHFITRAGTRPSDRRATTTPAEFGLTFEDVSFPSVDGVHLEGWYLGGGDRGVSVACAHGLFRSRQEMLARAVFLRKAGFNVILFDSRRHGQSGGERVTLGFKERLDVEGALNVLIEKAPRDRYVLMGVSMGAVAALLAAHERDEVSAVVADSSFLSLEHAVAHHLNMLWGLPRFPLGDELVFFIERQGGFKSGDLDIEKVVATSREPILFLAGGADRRMPPEIQERLFRASTNPQSRFFVFEGATHGAAYRTHPELYRDVVLEFLAAVVP